jgi:hypothetical protein
MFICPWDLEPCQHAACRAGTCERTAELLLLACSECGAIVAETRSNARLCAECLRAHAAALEQGA